MPDGLSTLGRIFIAKEAAEILRMDPRTVQRKCKHGEIEASFSGGKYLISEKAIERYLEDCKVNPNNSHPRQTR